MDFLLTAKRDLEAAKRFFRKALKEEPLLSPDRIGTDGAGAYPPAIAAARKDGFLARTPVHYVTKHLQQGIESDHFRVKRRMPRVGCFQGFHTPRRTIQGFEPILLLRKGFGSGVVVRRIEECFPLVRQPHGFQAAWPDDAIQGADHVVATDPQPCGIEPLEQPHGDAGVRNLVVTSEGRIVSRLLQGAAT